MKKFDLDQLKKMLEFADTLEAADQLEQAEELREMADAKTISLSQQIAIEKLLQGFYDSTDMNDPLNDTIKLLVSNLSSIIGFQKSADKTDK